MRNYSRQIPNTYYKYQSPARNYTQQKRLQELHTLKQSEVKVGIYKYSKEDELGKGYSSKVYKGVQIEKLHKRYAIKVIQLKKFRGSNLQMLEAEIEIHKNLVHENILRLHEVIKTPYFYYIILEYCPHGNLHEYIKQKKKLTQSNALQIMQQVLSGYKYLIEQGIIHRDLKPANILRIGNKWKISDFGFAVKSRYGFKDRINVGTPLYMPPQSLKKSYYSSKTDIFALGVILYEMIQGHTPWQSSNQKQLLQKIKNEIQIPQNIKSQAIKTFISNACQLNQNKRMSRQELIQIQIRPATGNDSSNSKVSQRQSAIAISSNQSRLLSRKASTDIPPQIISQAQDFIKNNENILMNEYLFVKHLNSCLKNIQSFLIQTQNKQIFMLILFKLILRLIRFLCDKKANTYNLKNWLEYITSIEYNSLYQEIILQSQILEKQYLQYIKHNDIKIIRIVNRKFPDLCHSAPISEKFYQSLKQYLVLIIRQVNHQLMEIFIASQEQIPQKVQKQLEVLEKQIEKGVQKQKEENIKQQKSIHASGPRKIYQSKRSMKLIQSIDIDPNFQINSQVHSQALKNFKESPSQQIVLNINIDPFSEIQPQKKELKLHLSQNIEQKQQNFTEISKTNPQVTKSNILNDKIQALESLYTIYRFAQLRCHQQQKLIGQRLKIINNYNQSKLNKRDYLDLRRLLRNL